MRRQLHKKTVLLAAAAAVLTVTLTVGNAMAYFTAYSTAKGSKELKLGFTETIPKETVDETGKHINIENVGDYDCFVRVKVFSDVPVSYEPGDGWREAEDGYWYYDPVLPAGKSTKELHVIVSYPAPEDPNKPEEFNVIVVQECTPVLFGEDGKPAADWNNVISDSE